MENFEILDLESSPPGGNLAGQNCQSTPEHKDKEKSDFVSQKVHLAGRDEPKYLKDTATAVPKNSVLLVSNLIDVDHQLLAHWIKTVTGIWPLSCHINDAKDKAVVKMPSIIDLSSFDKASEEEYFLHGGRLLLFMLKQTTKLLVEYNKTPHNDDIKTYFNSPECGLRNGQIKSIEYFDDNRDVFIITYSDHNAIPEIIQRGNHMFKEYKIEVSEFYAEAGYCRPRDHILFPVRTHEAPTKAEVSRLVVKDIAICERKSLELLMRNNRKSGGDKSAKISSIENVAYVSYEDNKVTRDVFEKSIKDGIFLDKKRLEMDLEASELTSFHDPKAVRLSGLPQDVDSEKLKFYLSDISRNLVTSMIFQENGDKAVAYFKENIDMRVLNSSYKTVKLDGYEDFRIQPELKSKRIIISCNHSDQFYVELKIEDIISDPDSVKLEPLKDANSTWALSVTQEDKIEILYEEFSKDKDLRVSKYSEFLGAKVTNGKYMKTVLLSEIVEDKFLLKFLLDKQLSGNKRLLNLLRDHNCRMSDDGAITMKYDSQQYVEYINLWKKLKAALTIMINVWCVDRSVSLPQEISAEFEHTQLPSSNETKVYIAEKNLVIIGEKEHVKQTVSMAFGAIKELEERKKEEREASKEVIALKNYEILYLSTANILSELASRYQVKELSLDISRSCLTIHANNKYIDVIKKEITAITSSLCEASACKSDPFIIKFERELASGRVSAYLKEQNLLAVCIADQKKLTAYGETKEIAEMALKCIDEVVWEVMYPEGRPFNEDEKKIFQQNKHLWEQAKIEITKMDSSIDIIDSFENTNVVVTGFGKDKQIQALKGIFDFFSKSLSKITKFVGQQSHINYIIQYMGLDLKLIEQKTKAKILVDNNEISLSGTDAQTHEAEQQLKGLCDKVVSANHKVEVDSHIQFLVNEPEIFNDLEKANQTLIILENEDELKSILSSTTAVQNNYILQIRITQRTTLLVKEAEVHEIIGCDGLAIPTSRNLKLDDINTPFAKYIKEKGGNEILNDCINSPEAMKQGGKLLPGSTLMTSAGEFRDIRRIIHMVLDADLIETRALEKSLKSTFLSAAEEGIKDLIIPMSSFPGSFDHNTLTRSIVKTIKEMEDKLPLRLLLLEHRSEKLNDLKTLLNQGFQSERNDLELPSRIPTSGSQTNLGYQPSRNEPEMLSETQLMIGGCKFTVMKGLLQESKQHAIVNSVGEGIILKENPLGKAISDGAGPKLQEECTSLAPLNEGEVKVSKAYNLQCKHILHCRLNTKYSKDQSEKDLMALIVECLQIVDQKLKCPSVAFPALGTGVLKYPPAAVAKCLMDGLKEYTSNNDVKHLSEVVVVIFHADGKVHKAFMEGLKKFAGPTQNIPTSSNQDMQKFQSKAKEASLCINNTKITVHHGDILQYAGKAIVCPTNKLLELKGAIAQQLIKDSYIEKKLAKVNLKEILSDGVSLVKTNSSKVRSKNYKAEYVFLVDCNWDSDSIAKKSLEQCQSKNIESIALPLIGAGERGLPPKDTAQQLLADSVDFVKNYGDGTIKNIDFVIFDQKQFQIFEAVFYEMKTTLSPMPVNEDVSKPTGQSKSPDVDSKVLKMIIYGVKYADIEATKKKLNDRLQKETVVIQWDRLDSYEEEKHLIAKLSATQIDYLHNRAEGMGICLVLDQDVMNIQISGNKNVIWNYKEIVKGELQKIGSRIHDEKLLEFQSSNIIWQLRDEKEEKWRDFHWEDSHSIESTHKQNQEGTLVMRSKLLNESLKIDLCKKLFVSHGNTYKIRRIDKSTRFPDDWDEAAGSMAEVALNKTSKEYQQVEDNFKKTIENPKALVLEIKRVQHLTAYNQYLEQRRLVAKKLKRSEDQVELVPLWHGSTEETVRIIAQTHFNRSHSGKNAVVYGEGCYFAKKASYSARDAYAKPNAAGEKCMLQVRVIVGEYTKGDKKMKYCPKKADGTSYDSVVDNVQNPTIFAVFHDSAAYPEYIIKFKI